MQLEFETAYQQVPISVQYHVTSSHFILEEIRYPLWICDDN